MRTPITALTLALALVVAAAALTAGASAAPELSAAERATLLAMREEEKLAHDVYVVLSAKTGLRIFANIAAAESRHEQAVERALAAYRIADVTDGYADGRFPTAVTQRLYDALVARGSASITAALEVGRWIERVDIADLKAAIAETDERLLDRTYTNLLSGSKRHLAAFERQLDMRAVAPAGRGAR